VSFTIFDVRLAGASKTRGPAFSRDEDYRAQTESMYLRYAGVRNSRDLQDAAQKV
jgi:hypothetical protein